ncbi:MAG: CBS domain-containing protein [Candidatus Hodarchaeales archaeon]
MDSKEFFIRDLTIDDEYDTILSDASVKDAALKMKELGIPDLIVIDDKEKVVGVIADFDIVTGLVAEGKSAEDAKITDVMYTIESVDLNTPVEIAFNRMRDLDVSVVPVIENGKLVGVATISDCWGFLPEKYEDQKGLIAVTNPRFANYGFTILMMLLYFTFGVLAPIVGITAFLKGSVVGSASASYSAKVSYYLFEARGGGFIFRYNEFQGDNSILWMIITLYGFIFILIGIISTYAIFHWAYADYHLIRGKRNWQRFGIVLGLVNILIEWLLFFVIVITGTLREPSIDLLGLLISGLSIIFLIAAVSRDFLFRESAPSTSEGV